MKIKFLQNKNAFIFMFIGLNIIFAGCNISGSAQKKEQAKAPPFGIDRRPEPAGNNLDVLLPKRVGAFEREDFPADLKAPTDEDLNVQYRSGEDSIFFGFSIPGTEKNAREAVRVTRAEAVKSGLSLKNERFEDKKNPGFFKIDSFMSWSRGGYFFYAQAGSPQALESFMEAFPY
jgi:hypothetical protein